MDNSKFIALFLQEAGEHLKGIESALMEIEGNRGNEKIIDDLFRRYHSIKGMSASMGYTSMQAFAHLQEDLLEVYRDNGTYPDNETCETLLECFDLLKVMTDTVKKGEDSNRTDTSVLTEKLISLKESALNQREEPAVEEKESKDSTTEKKASPSPSTLEKNTGGNETTFLKVDSSIFDSMLIPTGELFAVLSELKKMTSRSVEFRQLTHKFQKSLNNLYSSVLYARLVPFSMATSSLKRAVRDIAKERGPSATRPHLWPMGSQAGAPCACLHNVCERRDSPLLRGNTCGGLAFGMVNGFIAPAGD